MAFTSPAGLRPLRPPNSSALAAASLPHAIWLVIAATLAAHSVPGANAYSWNFLSNPQQCENTTIQLSGDGGQPPYRILILPFGATPLPNSIEARTIQEEVFISGSERSGSIKLNYPANSQFVAVVSDAQAFGSGGTSVATQVGSSSDASCFNPTKNVQPDFVFSIEPPNQVVQCQQMRIWWDPSTVQGMPNFLGVIPGGESFAIPQGEITQMPSQGTGFSWTPNVRGGTTLMLIGGDNRGNGTGGSVFSVVSSGINNTVTCLDQNSPSSTPGSPAGGTLPTGGAGSGSGGGGGSNTGAIVGGVIGGLALIVSLFLALFFFRRRSRQNNRVKERPVDLLHDDYEDEEDDHQHNPNSQPQHQLDYYTPEPFMVPDPLTSDAATTAPTDGHSHAGWGASSSGRPMSGTSYTRSDTPDLLGAMGGGASAYGYGWAAGSTTTGTSRKGGPMRMRPVNIVQHEDAGPPPPMGGDKEEETETIELPPAYTAVHKTPTQAEEEQPARATTTVTTGADSRPPGATIPLVPGGNE